MKKRQKKGGWFIGRGYRHFDHPLSFEAAKKLVSFPDKVAKHNFRPLLSYEKTERRFKGFNADGTAKIRHKSRLICYAAHRDAQIYAYYAFMLEGLYADLRKKAGIDDCVLAYRPGKGCNIDMANAAFEEIKKRDACSVLAFDISGFFDSIDHKNLRKQWCLVLGKETLPDDHYNLFRALTRFSRVEQERCLAALGIEEKALKRSTVPLCDDNTFHQKICGRAEGYRNLIVTNSDGYDERNAINWNSYGIPQGTPISAILSNIFMIDFDIEMEALAQKIGGTYRRYSDDILFICPPEQEDMVQNEVTKTLESQGSALRINKGKTEIARFQKHGDKFTCQVRKKDGNWHGGSVQYLGLSFDGRKKSLRHQTIARYQRKVKYAVRNARRTALHFKKDKIRSQALYMDLTDIGSQSMPSYAKRVARITGDPAAKDQLSTHKKDLASLIRQEDEKLTRAILKQKKKKTI